MSFFLFGIRDDRMHVTGVYPNSESEERISLDKKKTGDFLFREFLMNGPTPCVCINPTIVSVISCILIPTLPNGGVPLVLTIGIDASCECIALLYIRATFYAHAYGVPREWLAGNGVFVESAIVVNLTLVALAPHRLRLNFFQHERHGGGVLRALMKFVVHFCSPPQNRQSSNIQGEKESGRWT